MKRQASATRISGISSSDVLERHQREKKKDRRLDR